MSAVEPVTVSATSVAAKVMLVMPWYKTTNPVTAFSVMGLIDRRRTALCMNFGDAFVIHSRNSLADQFLASGLEWMLTIDDDMVVPFGDARWFKAYAELDDLPMKAASLNALDRLLASGKTLVGAFYCGRHRRGKPMYAEACNSAQEAKYAKSGPHDVIKPTRWVATGCMLVHRSVFLDIEKKFPRLARRENGMGGQWFTPSEQDAMAAMDRGRELLRAGKHAEALVELDAGAALAKANSGLGMGEDVSMCIRAKEAGHQPWVDLGLWCGHIGSRCYHPRNTL
jgi:hypothetical protein